MAAAKSPETREYETTEAMRRLLLVLAVDGRWPRDPFCPSCTPEGRVSLCAFHAAQRLLGERDSQGVILGKGLFGNRRALELAFGPPREPADLPPWATAYPPPQREPNPTERVSVEGGRELWRQYESPALRSLLAAGINPVEVVPSVVIEQLEGAWRALRPLAGVSDVEFPDLRARAAADAPSGALVSPPGVDAAPGDLLEGSAEGAGASRAATPTAGVTTSAGGAAAPEGERVVPAPSLPPRVAVPPALEVGALLEQLQRRCPELRGAAAALAASHGPAEVTPPGERAQATYPDALAALLREMALLIEREHWHQDACHLNPFCYGDP